MTPVPSSSITGATPPRVATVAIDGQEPCQEAEPLRHERGGGAGARGSVLAISNPSRRGLRFFRASVPLCVNPSCLEAVASSGWTTGDRQTGTVPWIDLAAWHIMPKWPPAQRRIGSSRAIVWPAVAVRSNFVRNGATSVCNRRPERPQEAAAACSNASGTCTEPRQRRSEHRKRSIEQVQHAIIEIQRSRT